MMEASSNLSFFWAMIVSVESSGGDLQVTFLLSLNMAGQGGAHYTPFDRRSVAAGRLRILTTGRLFLIMRAITHGRGSNGKALGGGAC
jgi:hypothetical protein